MASFRILVHLGWLATFYGLGLVPAHSQATQSVAPANPDVTDQTSALSDAAIQAYVQQQAALTQQRMTLVSQGASPVQLQAWYQQNAALIASQQQQAQLMAATAAALPSPIVQPPTVPASASPTMKAYVTEQFALANASAQIHNQLVLAMPDTATVNQVSQMEQSVELTFQQQNVGNLQVQVQRVQTLATEASQVTLPVPPALQILPSESTQEAAYHSLLHQFMVGRAQIWNQNINSDPDTRAAAMQAWWQQNASLIQQLQQKPQNLAQPSSNQN